ncbi:MAG TPA: lytic transglycosylase domain-containing protein [Firmicutes bacterium]|nr:lytic transglycosylase domain-containing protein [Bacillota bacterium]
MAEGRRSRAGWFLLIFLILVLVLGQVRWFLQKLYPITYVDEIGYHAWQRGVDPFLVYAVMYVESRLIPQAVSHRGARGLMQIMPDTARWIAKEMGIEDFHEDMLSDPGINISMGTWYLGSLYREFGADDVIVLAAYNAGRGNVARWLEEAVWSGKVTDVEQIPFPETREYVQRVLRIRDWYRYIYGGQWPRRNGGGEMATWGF